MAHIIEITVLDWKSSQARKDVKHTSFFRLKTSLFYSQEIFDLSLEERWVYVFLLSRATELNSPVFELHTAWVENTCQIPDKTLRAALIKLALLGRVTCTSRPRNAGVTSTLREHLPIKLAEKADMPSPVSEIRKAFCEAYEKEFARKYPGWGVKENSQAKTWLRSISLDKACELCALYPKWNDPWVTERGHTFGLLIAKYVELDAWAKSGPRLIEKIAQGSAVKRVEIKRAIEREARDHEFRQHCNELDAREATQDESRSRRLHSQLPLNPSDPLPSLDGDPFSSQVFSPRGEEDPSKSS